MKDNGIYFMDDSYLDNRSKPLNKVSITDEILLKSGFKQVTDSIVSTIKELNIKYKLFTKFTCDKYYISIDYGSSNVNDTNWTVQVDNEHHMSIAGGEISNVQQFNDFMKLFNINCRLNVYE